MRRGLLKAHRYISLVVALLWSIQAATGLLLVFHTEIDNALTPGASAPLDPVAMGQALDRFAGSMHRPVESIAVADRAGGRFDVFMDGDRRVARMTGTGVIVADGHGLDPAKAFDQLKEFHSTLWRDRPGGFLLGFSGLLLFSNLIVALKLAWPRNGNLRRALAPPKGGPPAAVAYATHRAVGLWFVLPAMVLVFAGFAMELADPFTTSLGADRPWPTATRQAAPISMRFDQAVERALARHPGARVSVVNLPTSETPWYRVRLRQRGEFQRFYGATEFFVDARTGQVLVDYDAHDAPVQRTAYDALYPLHTAEFLGWPGRLIAAAIGLWLLTMIVLGVRLWRVRRRAKAP